MRIEQLLLHRPSAGTSFRIVDDQGEWTHEALYGRAVHFRDTLLNKGAVHLTRVAIICENGSDFFVAVIGTLAAGCIAVPIDPQHPESLIRSSILKCDAQFVCVSGSRPESFAQKLKEDSAASALYVLNERSGDWRGTADEWQQLGLLDAPPFANMTDDDPAFILFSSGTTGAAKGSVLSHKAILANIEAIQVCLKLDSRDAVMILKTMVHSSTLTGELLLALLVGARVIALNPVVSPKTLLQRIESYTPTFICANPTIINLLLKVKSSYNLDSVHTLYSCGAPADRELLLKAQDVFRRAAVLNVYGMTEAGPRVTSQMSDDTNRVPGCVGRPIPGVQIEIRNEMGETCSTNEVGQIFIKSTSLMSYYWGDPNKTRTVLNDDGWLKSGDLGYWRDNGEIFVVGRYDDMIIRGGHNVNPKDIEAVVLQCDNVTDSIVFGVPDSSYNSKIVCAIVPKRRMKVSHKDIMLRCAGQLAPYECPQEIVCWSSIPATANGKRSRKLAIQYYFRGMP